MYFAPSFLSTPSARRATVRSLRTNTQAVISIHALREEGDAGGASWSRGQSPFLSTPSARRATHQGTSQNSYMQEFLSTPSARRATD